MRELHEKLEISQRFTDWFKYQCERLSLVDGTDFITILGDRAITGIGRPRTDYMTPVDIAKNIAMISGGPKAQEIRTYLIEVEKAWNSPEKVMARALRLTTAASDSPAVVDALTSKIAALEAKVKELAPLADYARLTQASEGAIPVADFAKQLRQAGVDTGRNRFYIWLCKRGYALKKSSKKYAPSQAGVSQGLLRYVEKTVARPDGRVSTEHEVCITWSGRPRLWREFTSDHIGRLYMAGQKMLWGDDISLALRG